MKIEDVEVIHLRTTSNGNMVTLPDDIKIDGEEWAFITNPKFPYDDDKYQVSSCGRVRQMKKYGRKLRHPIYLPMYVTDNSYYYYILTYTNPEGGKGIRVKRFVPKMIGEYFIKQPRRNNYVEFVNRHLPWPVFKDNLRWRSQGWTTSPTKGPNFTMVKKLADLIKEGYDDKEIIRMYRDQKIPATSYLIPEGIWTILIRLRTTTWYWYIMENAAVKEMEKNEIWVPVHHPVVEDDRYMISNYGRIKSMPKERNVGHRILHPSTCTWSMDNSIQYSLQTKTGRYSTFTATSLVANAFIAVDYLFTRKDFAQLKDPNARFPYHVDNIQLIDHDNWYDANNEYIHTKRGDRHTMAVCTEDEVRQICTHFQNGHTVMETTDLMRKYWPDGGYRNGYSKRIRHIYNRESWRHISKDYTW